MNDLIPLIDYAGKTGIEYIRTGTNGFLFSLYQKPDYKDRIKQLAQKLANTRIRNLWISIDSAEPKVHEQMRGFKGVIKGIEKALLFKALSQVINKYRSKIRIFSPLCALHTLYRQYGSTHFKSYPCRGGTEFFFIDSKTKDTYPCGYRGNESLGRFWEIPATPESAKLLKPDCHRCDWECFRDPSELFGPVLDFVSRPVHLWQKLRQDKGFTVLCGCRFF